METLKAIATRKSVRAFMDKQVNDKDLEIILASGGSAPIGMARYENMHITVVQNKEIKDRIATAGAKAFGQEGRDIYYGAPTVIIISGKNGQPGEGVIETLNAACMSQNMLLAATELGYGSIFIAGTMAAFRADNTLYTQVEIPQDFTVLASVAIGTAQETIEQKDTPQNKIAVNYLR